MIPELQKRGIFATNAEITNALKGRYTCKKGQTVLENCKEIVEKWEKEAGLASDKLVNS